MYFQFSLFTFVSKICDFREPFCSQNSEKYKLNYNFFVGNKLYLAAETRKNCLFEVTGELVSNKWIKIRDLEKIVNQFFDSRWQNTSNSALTRAFQTFLLISSFSCRRGLMKSPATKNFKPVPFLKSCVFCFKMVIKKRLRGFRATSFSSSKNWALRKAFKPLLRLKNFFC